MGAVAILAANENENEDGFGRESDVLAPASGETLRVGVPPAPSNRVPFNPAPSNDVGSRAERRAREVEELLALLDLPGLDDATRERTEVWLIRSLSDPSVSVRRRFAAALMELRDPPRHLQLALARDVPPVAEIVLRRAPGLLDVELLQIARDVSGSGGDRLRLAMAERLAVSADLAAALSERADLATALALACNAGADLARAAPVLAERHGTQPALRSALLARDDLDDMVRLGLIETAGERLAEAMALRGFGERAALDRAATTATLDVALELAETSPRAARTVVMALQRARRLTPKLVLRAAAFGRTEFLTAALSALTGANAGRVAGLIASPGSGGLEALCRRARLPAGFADALHAAAGVTAERGVEGIEDGERVRAPAPHRVLQSYERRARTQPEIHAALRSFSLEALRAQA